MKDVMLDHLGNPRRRAAFRDPAPPARGAVMRDAIMSFPLTQRRDLRRILLSDADDEPSKTEFDLIEEAGLLEVYGVLWAQFEALFPELSTVEFAEFLVRRPL